MYVDICLGSALSLFAVNAASVYPSYHAAPIADSCMVQGVELIGVWGTLRTMGLWDYTLWLYSNTLPQYWDTKANTLRLQRKRGRGIEFCAGVR